MFEDCEVMPPELKQELLKRIPPVTELLKSEAVAGWLKAHPLEAGDRLPAGRRRRRAAGIAGRGWGPLRAGAGRRPALLARASELLAQATTPRLRHAINATGIILHTGLGRAVFAGRVVDSIQAELKGYSTLAVSRESGERIERDELVEPILAELTGAEAATVVNNNAGATMLVLAALASQKEVIVSRGQLIEIGGSFRLPEVMAQSQARLVEVGATNRTHLKDYLNAITAETAAIMRVHPSNYRIVGFTAEPGLAELARLARERGLLLIDDLGAGALLDLEQFGLPHEPTVRQSIEAGADVVLFSGDKLIGASQAGIIAGRKEIDPAPAQASAHARPARGQDLPAGSGADFAPVPRPGIAAAGASDLSHDLRPSGGPGTPCPGVDRGPGQGRAQGHGSRSSRAAAYLGSGSLPTEAIPSLVVTVSAPGLSAAELARRLRLDEACISAASKTTWSCWTCAPSRMKR